MATLTRNNVTFLCLSTALLSAPACSDDSPDVLPQAPVDEDESWEQEEQDDPASEELPDAGPPTPTPRPGLSFNPTNIAPLLYEGREFAEDISVGSTCVVHASTGEGTGCLPAHRFFAVMTQEGASAPEDRIGVYFVKSLTIQEGATLFLGGGRPTAIVALEDIIVHGTIDASGGGRRHGDEPGLGQGEQSGFDGLDGIGATGGNYCGVYGGTVTPFIGGSAGGDAVEWGGGLGFQGEGGGGGLALQLVAGRKLEVSSTGRILADGGSPEHCPTGLGGPGGGSGGTLLLEATTVSIRGALSAVGGEGTCSGERGGGDGGEGYIFVHSATGAADVALDAVVAPLLTSSCAGQSTLAAKTDFTRPVAMCAATSGRTCDECAGLRCCEAFEACRADGLCNTCLDSEAPGPGCAGSTLLTAASECLRFECGAACQDVTLPE